MFACFLSFGSIWESIMATCELYELYCVRVGGGLNQAMHVHVLGKHVPTFTRA